MKKRKPKTPTTPKLHRTISSLNSRFLHPTRAVLVAFIFLAYSWAASSPNYASAHGTNSETSNSESSYALIFGTVWGPDDHPIYGVKVKIRRADQKKAHWELYSDHHGEFAQRVPAGKADYVVWADLKGVKMPDGKKPDPSPEVTVHVENDERVDTGLHLK
jgi:hypothetical protein